MEVANQMQQLRAYLDNRGIAWIDKSDDFDSLWICRTHFEFMNYNWSVINGYGTYGGINAGCKYNNGLLELMVSCVNGGEPIGDLTANDIISIMEKRGVRKEFGNIHD